MISLEVSVAHQRTVTTPHQPWDLGRARAKLLNRKLLRKGARVYEIFVTGSTICILYLSAHVYRNVPTSRCESKSCDSEVREKVSAGDRNEGLASIRSAVRVVTKKHRAHPEADDLQSLQVAQEEVQGLRALVLQMSEVIITQYEQVLGQHGSGVYIRHSVLCIQTFVHVSSYTSIPVHILITDSQHEIVRCIGRICQHKRASSTGNLAAAC